MKTPTAITAELSPLSLSFGFSMVFTGGPALNLESMTLGFIHCTVSASSVSQSFAFQSCCVQE